jgi:shikimate kinase
MPRCRDRAFTEVDAREIFGYRYFTMSDTQPDVPYRNLVLTGHLATGKRLTGQYIATRLKAPLVDIESEIQAQEGNSLDEIRALYGEARARTLAQEACRNVDLRRGTVIVVSGGIFLNPTNRERLSAGGDVLCLVCDLNEILRRMYTAMGARFHTPAERARIVARIKRERPIRDLNVPILDTTPLSIEQVADRAIAYWRRGVDGLKPLTAKTALSET